MSVHKRAHKIVTDLEKQRIFKTEEIFEHLRASNITTSNEMLDVFDAMTTHELMFSLFIRENLINYADSSSKFIRLVVRIAQMESLGHTLHGLGKLYEKDPDIAIFLCKNLQNLDEYKVALALSYILGGIGYVKPQKLFEIIDSNKNPTVNNKISYAHALRSVDQAQKPPKRFVDLLISYACSDDKNLRRHAVGTLMIWLNNMRKVQKFLISYARQNDENKDNVLEYVISIEDNEDFCIHILKICSNADAPQLINKVGMTLRIIAPKRPIEVLTIVRKWCRRQEAYFNPASMCVVGDIEKNNINEIEEFLLKWIKTEKNKITCLFRLPGIMIEIYREKPNDLIKLLSKIDHTEKKKSQLIIKTLQKFLSEKLVESKKITGRTSQDPKQLKSLLEDVEFFNSCDQILMRIVNHGNLEIFPDRAIDNRILKTLALVDAVKFGEKKTEPSVIKKSLKHFPNIVSFFGEGKLIRLIDKKPAHPFVRLLARASVSEYHVKRILRRRDQQKDLWRRETMLLAARLRHYPTSVLCDMDASFAKIGEKEQGRKRLRDGMLDENDFYPTLTELNVYARFSGKYPIQLHPTVGDKKLDAKVIIDDTTCLFEIYTPEEDIMSKYVRTTYHKKNKAKKKILDKLNQLKAANSLNLPVILIIDRTIAVDYDDMDITDSLLGPYQVVLEIDKKSSNIVGEYVSRNKKSTISQESTHGKVISAVMLIKRDIRQDSWEIKLEGNYYSQPGAAIPISEKLVKKITDALFE